MSYFILADGKNISRKVAHLNILVHDMINSLYYKLIAADLNKQKALDADSRAIQKIIFNGKRDNGIRTYYILEQSKETILEFSKGTTNVL